jgi:hypothetical protein
MRLTFTSPIVAALGALAVTVVPARAQTTARLVRPTGRISFYVSASESRPADGASLTAADLITHVSYQLPDADGDGLEYGVDMRHSRSSGTFRPARVSVYDGYVGARLAGGRLRVRAGQMWLSDLGGLGSLAGTVVEFKQPASVTGLGRWRIGGFVGLEPRPYTLGPVPGVRKVGAYGILEGGAGRRHVVGYVRLDNRAVVERSVVTTSQFIPVRSKVFVFQAAEYDLVGPAGQGTGGLTYLMVNAHASPVAWLDLQALHHRGRSIDTRAIAEDVIAARPLRDGALDALRYASTGGRASVRVGRDLRLQAGYTRDRNNRDSAATDRVLLGGSAADVAGSGVDVTVTNSRIGRPTGTYNSIYASAGRQIGRSVYASFDYSTSVSIVRFTRSDGITIETRPETTQFGVSALVTAGRHVSMSLTAEETRDGVTADLRVLAGLTYRLR